MTEEKKSRALPEGISRNKQFSVRIRESIYKDLHRMSHQDLRSMADLVNELISDYVERRNKKEKGK